MSSRLDYASTAAKGATWSLDKMADIVREKIRTLDNLGDASKVKVIYIQDKAPKSFSTIRCESISNLAIQIRGAY